MELVEEEICAEHHHQGAHQQESIGIERATPIDQGRFLALVRQDATEAARDRTRGPGRRRAGEEETMRNVTGEARGTAAMIAMIAAAAAVAEVLRKRRYCKLRGGFGLEAGAFNGIERRNRTSR